MLRLRHSVFCVCIVHVRLCFVTRMVLVSVFLAKGRRDAKVVEKRRTRLIELHKTLIFFTLWRFIIIMVILDKSKSHFLALPIRTAFTGIRTEISVIRTGRDKIRACKRLIHTKRGPTASLLLYPTLKISRKQEAGKDKMARSFHERPSKPQSFDDNVGTKEKGWPKRCNTAANPFLYVLKGLRLTDEAESEVFFGFFSADFAFAHQPAETEIEIFLAFGTGGLFQFFTSESTFLVEGFPDFSGEFAGFLL